MTVIARIRRMAARSIGVAAIEIEHAVRSTVSTACFKLAAKGELHRAVLGPKAVRYFVNPEMRDAFVRMHEQELAERKAAKQVSDDGFRPSWAPGVEAVVPAHVRVQRCPAFEPRFQERVPPGIVSFGLQRGRVTLDEVDAALGRRRTRRVMREWA